MGDTMIFLQKLLADTIGIPFSQIPFTASALLDFLQHCTNHIFDDFFRSASWHQLLQGSAQTDTIYECIAPFGVSFLLYGNKPSETVFVLGPVLTAPFSRATGQTDPSILQFCSNLPVVANHTFYRTGDLVFGHLTGQTQPLKIVQPNVPLSFESHLLHSALTPGVDIIQMRQVEMRYEYSATLTDAIRQGNLSLALHMVGRYDPNTQTTVRNANPLRNAQNYCVVLNTQLRHALEESGIHPYQVDKLSNEIGLEIEQLKSTAQLPDFYDSVIRRYCRLVQEHAYPNLKPLTNLAVTYIKEHLADNLTVKDTAKALTVNANYLSTVFHKEMGMTFIDFLNKERTVQAAALLKHTSLQIQQIASMVGYNNTSYFAKQFVRSQGVSPSQYRRS